MQRIVLTHAYAVCILIVYAFEKKVEAGLKLRTRDITPHKYSINFGYCIMLVGFVRVYHVIYSLGIVTLLYYFVWWVCSITH